jgi:putative NADPH-quinone reductase
VSKRIAIIQGHPDPSGRRFGHALALAYAGSAAQTGHEVKSIDVARIEFPFLRSKEEWETGSPPDVIREAQRTIGWADHLVILYPLWLGAMPSLLKAFLEQVFRPAFSIVKLDGGTRWRRQLAGKSARVVVTMGMPVFVYRWYFRAHSLKSLERNVLRFCGIGPIRESLIGLVESKDGSRRRKWLAKMTALGAAGR